MLAGLAFHISSFKYLQKKKSIGFKSGNRSGQGKSDSGETNLSGKRDLSQSMEMFEVCSVGPSSWEEASLLIPANLLENSVQAWQHKVLLSLSEHSRFFIFKEEQSKYSRWIYTTPDCHLRGVKRDFNANIGFSFKPLFLLVWRRFQVNVLFVTEIYFPHHLYRL